MSEVKVLKFGTIREEGEDLIVSGFEFELAETKSISSTNVLYAISVYLNKYKKLKIRLEEE